MTTKDKVVFVSVLLLMKFSHLEQVRAYEFFLYAVELPDWALRYDPIICADHMGNAFFEVLVSQNSLE